MLCLWKWTVRRLTFPLTQENGCKRGGTSVEKIQVNHMNNCTKPGYGTNEIPGDQTHPANLCCSVPSNPLPALLHRQQGCEKLE